MTDETLNQETSRQCFSCHKQTVEELSECAIRAGDTCKDCLRECHECRRPICDSCENSCMECNEPLCEDCVLGCTDCDKQMCDHCAKSCEECEATICPHCAERCEQCGENFCSSCIYACAECGRRTCSECQFTCEHCDDTLCDLCGYTCDNCERLTCGDCTYWCEYCDRHWCSEDCRDECPTCGQTQEPDYRNPYQGTRAETLTTFTVGLEIEIDDEHNTALMTENPLIAGWCRDGSLSSDGREYQTHPMTMRDLAALTTMVASIEEPPSWGNAGGHMHISRTDRQTPSRWYWALKGLTPEQCADLNMRHQDDCRWCHLTHNRYCGKDTAVNADHWRTIELRTFGAWHSGTVHKLAPAIRWAHTMWRLFQHHPKYSLKQADIMACSRTAHHAAMPTPRKENR